MATTTYPDWAPSTKYHKAAPASFVAYAGKSWVCRIDHTSGLTFDPSKWIQAAGTSGLTPPATQADLQSVMKGDKGDQGPAGPQGRLGLTDLGALLGAWLASLPTNEPATPGAWWNNDGVPVQVPMTATQIATYKATTGLLGPSDVSNLLSIWMASLSSDSSTDQKLWYANDGVPTLANALIDSLVAHENKMSAWLDSLPTTMPDIPGTWWNNGGVPARKV